MVSVEVTVNSEFEQAKSFVVYASGVDDVIATQSMMEFFFRAGLQQLPTSSRATNLCLWDWLALEQRVAFFQKNEYPLSLGIKVESNFASFLQCTSIV